MASRKGSKSGRRRSCCGKKRQSKCFISISATWYALAIVLVHVYLIKNRVDVVLVLSAALSNSENTGFSSLVSDNRTSPGQDNRLGGLFDVLRDEVDGSAGGRDELIVRLSTLSVSVLFLALFVICSLQKCANYANDNVKFGRDFFAEQLHHHRKHLSRVNYHTRTHPDQLCMTSMCFFIN